MYDCTHIFLQSYCCIYSAKHANCYLHCIKLILKSTIFHEKTQLEVIRPAILPFRIFYCKITTYYSDDDNKR